LKTRFLGVRHQFRKEKKKGRRRQVKGGGGKARGREREGEGAATISCLRAPGIELGHRPMSVTRAQIRRLTTMSVK